MNQLNIKMDDIKNDLVVPNKTSDIIQRLKRLGHVVRSELINCIKLLIQQNIIPRKDAEDNNRNEGVI